MEPIETMNHEGGLQEGGEDIIHTTSVQAGDENAYTLLEWFECVESARALLFALVVRVSYD